LSIVYRLNIYFFLIIISVSSLFSQTITVINETDKNPIFNVFIFDEHQSTITNEIGQADINTFGDKGRFNFQHPAFKNLSIEKSKLEQLNYLIKLEESVLNIDEVVVSANQWEQQKSEVPNKIHTLSSRDIQFNNPQTSADLVGSSDNVFIQKSQMGGGSPMIRGFSANRILLVVDGVRMNNAIFRSGNLQNVISLDPNAVENSEVILGPGSVIYGSDAIGGVIDFHTKRPKLSTGEEAYISSNSLLRYSSASFEKTAHADLNIGFNKVAFLSSLSFTDYDDLMMGTQKHEDYQRLEYADVVNGSDSVFVNSNKNLQRFSAYNQFNLLQKIRYRPTKETNIEYAFHYSKLADVPRYDKLLEYEDNTLKYASWNYGPQKWMMNSLKVTKKSETILFDNSKFIMAIQNYEESRHDRKLNSLLLRNRYENVKLFTINIDFDKVLVDSSTLYYGFEIADNLVNSYGEKENNETGEINQIGSRYPDNSKYSSMSFYINQKRKLKNKLSLIYGFRYNHINIYADFDTTFYPFPFTNMSLEKSAVNGSAGLVFIPKENIQYRVNLSTGFRSPNIDDVGKVFDSEPGNVVVPNENLGPEYIYNVDLGYVSSFKEKVQLEATLFGSYINHVMVRKDFSLDGMDSIMYDGTLSKVQAYVNADYGMLYGIHISVYADIVNHLSFKSHFNYIKGWDQDNNPLRHVAPYFGGTHLIYSRENFKADLYSVYNGTLNFDELSASEQAKPHIYASDENGNPYSPSWATLNLKTSFQINKALQINAGIENILDIRYRPYSSGIVAPARNFIIALRARF